MKTSTLILMLLLPLFATAQKPTELAIAGKANTEVTPDLTIVTLRINALDKSYSTAMDLLQEKSKETKRFLKKKGIGDSHFSSENFSINKQYAYESHKQVFKGYNATLNLKLEFKNDLKLANKILNALGESNADADVSVYHQLSQDLQDKVDEQLISAAIEDAQRKANIIANSTGQSLKQIIKINYGVREYNSASPQIESRYMAMAKSEATGSENNLSITPQPVKRSTEITIYWWLVQR